MIGLSSKLFAQLGPPDEFKQRFLSKASGFQDYAMEIKVKKLHFLRLKQNSTDVTPVRDDQKSDNSDIM